VIWLSAWCPAPSTLSQCSGGKPTSQITLTMNLTVAPTNPDLKCCLNCECHGDPECTAFNGQPAAWVLCDGSTKNAKNCKIEYQRTDQPTNGCWNKVDSYGNACAWNQTIYDLIGSSLSAISQYGSPCRPASDSPAPTMLMYKRGDYQCEIVLGERGVIDSMSLDVQAGKYVLDAGSCWEQYQAGTALAAWEPQGGAGPLPNATYKLVSSKELLWYVVDPGTGIRTEVKCINRDQAGAEVYARLDISNIFEPVPEQAVAQGSGYCKSGAIDIGAATPLDQSLYEYCAAFSPQYYVAALVSPAATQSDVQASVSRWCDLAVPKQSDKSKCYSSILGSSGGTTSNDANWAKWLCQANNLGAPNFNSAVNSCISYISANGINNYVAQYGPGYGLAKAGDLRCAPDASYYSPRTQAQSCQMGLSVQYLKTGGTNEWVEEFFVPTDFPPCTPLVLTAAAYPTLFTNEMQVTQCDLPAECKLQGSCEQAPGFQTMINYAGCP